MGPTGTGDSARPISFGITQEFRRIPPDDRPFSDVYDEALHLIERADELGFGHVWVPEHHFVTDGFCSSPLAVAGAILARTERIHFSTHAFLLPLHNPVRVAEDVATLDVLSKGRMELGVAMGYRHEEFLGLGIDPSTRRSRLDEACDLLLRVWLERNVTHNGPHFSATDVSISPRPVQLPHPKLWVGAGTPKASTRAVRLRSSLLLPPPGFGASEAAVYEAYAAGLRAAGESPDDPERFSVAASFTCVVTDDPAAYKASHRDGWRYKSELYAEWGAAQGSGKSPDSGKNQPDRPIGVIGSAAECIDGLGDFLSGPVPVSHVVMNLDTVESLERFAAEVMPAFG